VIHPQQIEYWQMDRHHESFRLYTYGADVLTVARTIGGARRL
jgi:hypothetical protein